MSATCSQEAGKAGPAVTPFLLRHDLRPGGLGRFDGAIPTAAIHHDNSHR